MLKGFRIFLVILVLCISVSLFAQTLSYQQITSVISNVYNYVLSTQNASGAFIFSNNGNKEMLNISTAIVLSQLRQLGFPTNTLVFSKGLNFLDSNYSKAGADSFYSLYLLLNIQGKTNVELSSCAQFVKNAIVKNYLLLVWMLPEGFKGKKVTKDAYSHELAVIPVILDIIKYSDEKELLRVLNFMPKNVSIKQVDIDEMLPTALSEIYKSLSTAALKAYNGKNAPVVLYNLTKINDVILNGYGEKIKEEEMFHVQDSLKSPTVRDIIGEIESSQATNGSWSVRTLGDFQNSLATPSQLESAVLTVTSMDISSLLKSGVPATNSAVEKGVEYIVSKLSSKSFLESHPGLSESFSFLVESLSDYLNARWGKTFSIAKLPTKYVGQVSLNKAKFSELISKMYMAGIEYYVSQAILNEFNF